MLTILSISVGVFVSTNIDDILLLSVFFADRRLHPGAVVLGQLAGMAVLFAASSLCSLASLLVPPGWTALLGLAPLAMGLWLLLARVRGGGASEDEPELAASRRTGSGVVTVALVTVANGGDNLAVYIPLFARDTSAIPIHAAVFLVMTAVWCGLGYLLVNNPLSGERVRRYGHLALPFVLLALGTYILSDARVLLE